MIIKEQKQLEDICEKFSKEDFITIDTEFLREKTYFPKLCLIQIGDKNKNAYAIDPLMDHIDLSPIYNLLQNEKVVKVFHAARQDLEIFYNLTGKVVTPLFDTQIAAMVLGYGDSVGYENIVRNVTGNQIDKSSQYTNWSHRPLSDKQITYALGDVTHLVDVYLKLAEQLEERGRTKWVFEEKEILADPATYENNPREMWRKVKIRTPKPKTLAVLRELAAWREERAIKKDIPRTWVMRDDTMADIASQSPRKPEDLKKIRNIPGEFTKSHKAENIIKLIEKGLKTPAKDCPDVVKKKPLPAHVSVKVDILKMLLKIKSAEYGVAAKLIASSDDLEQIAFGNNDSIPALKGWRYEVFGEDAIAMKDGKLAIGLKESQIVKIPI